MGLVRCYFVENVVDINVIYTIGLLSISEIQNPHYIHINTRIVLHIEVPEKYTFSYSSGLVSWGKNEIINTSDKKTEGPWSLFLGLT